MCCCFPCVLYIHTSELSKHHLHKRFSQLWNVHGNVPLSVPSLLVAFGTVNVSSCLIFVWLFFLPSESLKGLCKFSYRHSRNTRLAREPDYLTFCRTGQGVGGIFLVSSPTDPSQDPRHRSRTLSTKVSWWPALQVSNIKTYLGARCERRVPFTECLTSIY